MAQEEHALECRLLEEEVARKVLGDLANHSEELREALAEAGVLFDRTIRATP